MDFYRYPNMSIYYIIIVSLPKLRDAGDCGNAFTGSVLWTWGEELTKGECGNLTGPFSDGDEVLGRNAGGEAVPERREYAVGFNMGVGERREYAVDFNMGVGNRCTTG